MDTVNKKYKEPIELMPKPSDMMAAIIYGLLKWAGREDARVAMYTFGMITNTKVGGSEHPLCLGCAATAAVIHLVPDAPVDSFERFKFFEQSGSGNWGKFENVVDDFRTDGSTRILSEYYGLEFPEELRVTLPKLSTVTWEAGLPAWVDYRDMLVAGGF